MFHIAIGADRRGMRIIGVSQRGSIGDGGAISGDTTVLADGDAIGVAVHTGVSGVGVGTIGGGVEKSGIGFGIGFRHGCHKGGTQSENYELKLH